MNEWKIRNKVNMVIKFFFQGKTIIAQAPMLHRLFKHKYLRDAIKLLGIRDSK